MSMTLLWMAASRCSASVKVALATTLVDLLRHDIALTGCDHDQYGVCTVLIYGKRINSCLQLAMM